MRALPEFTAEASIYRTAHQYRSVAAWPFRGPTFAVAVAIERPELASMVFRRDARWMCWQYARSRLRSA